MKNFPNQISDPEKFRQALEAIASMPSSNNPGDDDDLGAELARRGIYGLAGKGTFAERLERERAKPPSNQGMRTAAREMRRSLVGLGLLEASLTLTPTGRALIDEPAESAEGGAIWRQALMELAVGTGNATSHPVRVLLRLVAARHIYGRDGMELALEARNDSNRELNRILPLLDLDAESRRGALEISKAQQENARKVFPRLAEYAGLIEQASRRDPWVLTELGRNALATTVGVAPSLPPQKRIPPRRRTGFRSAKRALGKGPITNRRPKPRTASRARPTIEEQAAADQRLFERTGRHEALVDCLLAKLPAKSHQAYEDSRSYDALVDLGSDPLLLFEMKTLELDEATQTRLAIGQLIFYEGVVVADEYPGRTVERVAVFEAPLPDYLVALLTKTKISAIWCDGDGLHALNRRADRVTRLLGN